MARRGKTKRLRVALFFRNQTVINLEQRGGDGRAQRIAGIANARLVAVANRNGKIGRFVGDDFFRPFYRPEAEIAAEPFRGVISASLNPSAGKPE
jgi:hypothetical protein